MRPQTAQGPDAPRFSGASGVAFGMTPMPRRPKQQVISRLNTQPARAPVNASPAPLPSPTHDSGSPWIAIPSACDSFLHYNSPVSRRTRPNPSLKWSNNGRPPGPGLRYAVHFLSPNVRPHKTRVAARVTTNESRVLPHPRSQPHPSHR
jgi:hypothetical protein